MEWHYSSVHQSPCKIIEKKTMFNQTTYVVWLSEHNKVVRVTEDAVKPLELDHQPKETEYHISYLAAAAKVSEVLHGRPEDEEQVLLAPMESNVVALPHQTKALTKAISGDTIRYLLADEVGLGKTIEAGLIMRELKLRGFIDRTLVVAPKGIATQWVSEMETHFDEEFQLLLGEDLNSLDRIKGSRNDSAWSMFDQVVVSLDSVKPIDNRAGWSNEKVTRHNQSRFEGLINAGWDLIIVDEAHKIGGSTDQVARHKLGRGLADAAPYFLLLSATPHQGKSDAFYRIMNLLDAESFPDERSVAKERVKPYVIRTEKRKAIDEEGKPLFKARKTEMATVSWGERYKEQEMLYEAVTGYVREGYNKAIQEQKHHIGFLLILMQRLVVSSTRAIRTTLERRLAVLHQQADDAYARLNEKDIETDVSVDIEDLYEMDGQELLEQFIKSRISALKDERKEVAALLEQAKKCEQIGPDAKTEALLEWVYKLQSEENDPDLKLLIFTEFVPTQLMLQEFFEKHGYSVVLLNGSMNMEERKAAQDKFRDQSRILISTDAGGEGINLQFCHVVINYDIPWNPMRLEQRIGRVDRIGQSNTVRAVNFVFEDSVEHRVREVLEQKLSVIFDEFGIDKTSDVLDSSRAGELFEEVFTEAYVNPDDIEEKVDHTVSEFRDEIAKAKEDSPIYGVSEEPDFQKAEYLRTHPLPYWVERMTVNYIQSQGGKAEQKRSWWELKWPDGEYISKGVFNARDARRLTDAALLNMEHSKVRHLTQKLPQFVEGQAIPSIKMNDMPADVIGYWGLFEISLITALEQSKTHIRIPFKRSRYAAVFLNNADELFIPTARYIWEKLIKESPTVTGHVNGENAKNAYEKLFNTVQNSGKEQFEMLKEIHGEAVEKEKDRWGETYRSRKESIERIGLEEVRSHRLKQLDSDHRQWQQELELAQSFVPDVKSIQVLYIYNDE